MSIGIVTGSSGLVGSETVRHFVACGLEVIGVDNNLREHFFGGASVAPCVREPGHAEAASG